jgi:hypothetical protein
VLARLGLADASDVVAVVLVLLGLLACGSVVNWSLNLLAFLCFLPHEEYIKLAFPMANGQEGQDYLAGTSQFSSSALAAAYVSVLLMRLSLKLLK